jgi:Exocyst complex component SEC3 N-terminal PIP2 binding PH
VRMHKARENSNGSFSIGKTWSLNLLEKLEERDTLGFVMTIQKPYYWATETPEHKNVFICALIQIYRRSTGGKSPEIVGFEPIFKQSGIRPQSFVTEGVTGFPVIPTASFSLTQMTTNAARDNSDIVSGLPQHLESSSFTPEMLSTMDRHRKEVIGFLEDNCNSFMHIYSLQPEIGFLKQSPWVTGDNPDLYYLEPKLGGGASGDVHRVHTMFF